MLHDVDKAARVAESVEVDDGFRFDAEFFEKIIFAGENLAHKALACGQVAVRLEIPAAHDVPFALFDELLDAPEERGIVFLHPFIKHRLVVAENKALVILAEICRYAESGKRLRHALLDLPKPYGVDMRVADQMKIFFHIVKSFLLQSFTRRFYHKKRRYTRYS